MSSYTEEGSSLTSSSSSSNSSSSNSDGNSDGNSGSSVSCSSPVRSTTTHSSSPPPPSCPTLEFYKTLWGVEEEMASLLPSLSSRGFDGIEACLFFLSAESKEVIKKWCIEGRLKVVCLILTGVDHGDKMLSVGVKEHLASLEAQINVALEYRPIKINIHGGVDAWTWDEQVEYFNGFLALEKRLNVSRAAEGLPPITLMHETHRGRILYSPWSTLRIMQNFPSLVYTADVSHWVVVAERHLDCFPEAMQLLNERTRHIHARPSSTQHIQLYNLTDPAYHSDLEGFKSYWRKIIQTQVSMGNAVTVDPEFGPFPYFLSFNGTTTDAIANIDTNIAAIIAIIRDIFAEVTHKK